MDEDIEKNEYKIEMNDQDELDLVQTEFDQYLNGNNAKSDDKCYESSEDTPSCTICGYRVSQIKWSNVIFLSVMHILAVYGYYHCVISPIKVLTVTFIYIISCCSGFGILVGSHRLWAHRSFKARWPLRLLLMIFQTMSVNGSIFSYVRDHRTHHKWSDTVADPKNSNRGFFFAHIGWWLIKKDPKVIEFGRKLNYDDLWNDPIVRYQHIFYKPLIIIFCFLLPALIPLLWREDPITSFLSCVCIRAVVVLHHMWTVNSIAHIYGQRIYDKNLKPTENKLVIWLSMGEGSHNYHHAFPWDYTTSHHKWYESFNPATLFIVIASFFGFAYDLKRPSNEMVRQCATKKGDIVTVDDIHDRNICCRLLTGGFDWIMGGIVTSWVIWSIILIKIALGMKWWYLDYNDFIWVN